MLMLSLMVSNLDGVEATTQAHLVGVLPSRLKSDL
jgi:hypothetical protein